MTEEHKENNILKVTGSKGSKESDKNYVKQLSNAIGKVNEKHGSAVLRCVGAASVNNAVKAIIIALSGGEKWRYSIEPSFTQADFEGQEKTGIALKISIDKGEQNGG